MMWVSFAPVDGSSSGGDDDDDGSVVLAAGTAGAGGGVQLLRWRRGSGGAAGGCSRSCGDSIELLAAVRLGCNVSWCGFVPGQGGGLLATASAAKLVQLWAWATDAAGGASLVLQAAFPAGARFGSPDGVGGQGDVRGSTICIGDEAGRLYCLSVERV